MKAEQVKNIINKLLEDANYVCTDEDQRRAFFQGARQMIQALNMNGILNREEHSFLHDAADKEVLKILGKAFQS